MHLSLPCDKLMLKTLTRKIFIMAILAGAPVVMADGMAEMDHSQHRMLSMPEQATTSHHHHQQNSTEVKRSTAIYVIPKVSLVNQHGDVVSLDSLLDTDKPILLNFIYTSCTAICPPMSATFSKVQSKLGEASKRLTLVSISIDPEHDTPQELNKYAERFGALSQWSFFTGTLAQSIEVQRAFDAYHGNKMNHVPLTLFRAKAANPWIRYDGFASVADLEREVRGALLD